MAHSATRATRAQKQKRRLSRAFETAQASHGAGELALAKVSAMVSAHSPEERLLGLVAIRVLIEAGEPPSKFLELSASRIGDPDSTCSWQACIAVGESISSNPDAVWRTILDHCDSEDEDLQAAISCVLLEHLLEEHFDAYFPRLKREFWAGHTGLQRVLRSSWFDMTSRQRSQVERFLDRGR